MDSEKRYLFVCGCGRSGTSNMAYLLGHHPKVVMGVERYHNLVLPKFKLKPSHFKYQRFMNFLEKDSHHNMFEHKIFKELYPLYKNDFRKHYLIGDKVPMLYYQYDSLFKNFESAAEISIIFMVRNIYDVANSYMTRYLNTEDRWKRDFDTCIKDWNDSLTETERIIQQGKKVHVIQFEDFYYGDTDSYIVKLCQLLGISISNELFKVSAYLNELKTLKNEERKMAPGLTTLQKRRILIEANIPLYRKFISEYSL